MGAKQRTEREVSRTIRLGRAQRGVEGLRRAALAAEQEFSAELKLVAPSMRESAFNLVHYLAVRRHDVRELQGELARLGLSSLGRMEAHVMASLQAVLQMLCTLRGESVSADVVDDPPITFETGAALLVEHTNAILGPATQRRHTRIMVTMPREAAYDPDLIRRLVEAGMGIMRINCAHDSPEIWERMVKHLREAERDLGKRCLVSFDLAGPKLRTGPIAPGPAVIKWRPTRNALGQMNERARVRLMAGTNQPDAKKDGDALGRDATYDDDGRLTEPAFVSCALAEVFSGVRIGEPILFDDGKFRGVIRDIGENRLRVEITGVAGGVAKLKSEKGINLPESNLALPALTLKDIKDLAFVTKRADAVAMSFVQHPKDIDDLLREIEKLNVSQLGIMLKIETKTAFNQLPDLLLRAMRHPPIAVMIARGDLGVEVGFERLSEVQEEILWLCEAAHVPVIWATQVLESLAKGGMPSRAEVSDAAMSSRAECVMLNKGPYIRETLRFLTSVLERIEEHHYIKTARLRKLQVARRNSLRTPDA